MIETHRRRFILANVLSLVITLVVSTMELALSGGMHGVVHFGFGLLISIYYVLSLRAALRKANVDMLARIWMSVGALALWGDIAISGGLDGHTSLLILLLPVGAGLLLGIRDILIVGIANILAIFALLYLETVGMAGWPQAAAETAELASRAILAATVSAALTATTITMVAHHQRIDRALRGALERTSRSAGIDGLSLLANRRAATEALERLDPDRDCGTVLLLDLDKFKAINDIYGHATGDAVLIEFSRRLKALTQPTDMVARLGGDEFMILVNGAAAADHQTPALADRIITAMATPFQIGELELQISCSIGSARFPFDAMAADDLLARADLALYAAKATGRNGWRSFDPEMEHAKRTRYAVQTKLRSALASGDIHAHYQPQIDLRTGQVVGMEALARWTDPEFGVISPSEFIPIAEDFGLVLQLGEAILRRA
ncbi:MAG: diguanylate cyclase, partial [Pseudomonadota bacterium]